MSAASQRPHDSRSERQAREARRLARQSWPIRRYALGDEPPDDLRQITTPGQRLAMVWPLTLLSWRLAGRELPAYERRETPGRMIRSIGAD
jgi:hypothetical protein